MTVRADWDSLRSGLDRARLAERIDALRAFEVSRHPRPSSRLARRRTATSARTPKRSGGART